MDQSAFYGVVSGINFTLLGLWWVAIKDRNDLSGQHSAARRMAYLVSLQFVIPATVSLLAQVSPSNPEVWRFAFALAGLFGALGVGMLAHEMLRSSDSTIVPIALAVGGIPCYVLAFLVALKPSLVGSAGLQLSALEVEGLLLSILVFLGVQEAWFVAMTPQRAAVAALPVSPPPPERIDDQAGLIQRDLGIAGG